MGQTPDDSWNQTIYWALIVGRRFPAKGLVTSLSFSNSDGTKIKSQNDAPQLAALDLGSNSFHLLIAQENQGRVVVVDKYKEMVRLGEGLINGGRLNSEIKDRALLCLTRIAQRIRPIASENLRIVGTNTLRQLSSNSAFVTQAEEILGHPIEIISGREEARLIYLGVCQDLGDNTVQRLVIDIGGGSTELIIGHSFSPSTLESLHVGCVSMSRKHFRPKEKLSRAFRNAIDDALIELEPVAQLYLASGWDQVIGASGTINSVVSVQKALGLGTQISLVTLSQIQKAIIDLGTIKELPGLPEERHAVFAGGISILIAIFKTFNLESMEASQSALREGVIYDLLGRKQNSDIRNQTVEDLATRFGIDQNHASRVERTATLFFDQVSSSWNISQEASRRLLAWAVELHEIGMDVSHNAYHKHGAYLLSHMDMPGFSRTEQSQLASLVGMHRRKIDAFVLENGPSWVVKLGLLLRLAALLHRHRSDAAEPKVLLTRSIEGGPMDLELCISNVYLNEHPLTTLDLQNEVAHLQIIGISLCITTDAQI